jgi:hypothetical protein
VISPLQAILDYEIATGIPRGYINGTIAANAPRGAWQRLERGELSVQPDGGFFEAFDAELNDAASFHAFLKRRGEARRDLPVKIDARALFWRMMRAARRPDPFVFPALLALKRTGRFVIAALSNTVDFPTGVRDEAGVEFASGLNRGSGAPPAAEDEIQGEVRSYFDVFVSSAHVGMRKPEPRIYEFALEEVTKVAREKGIVGRGERVRAEDVVFLDDIGTNVKAARKMGMRTIKVVLGESRKAVEELEKEVGMDLLGNGPESSRL